MMLKLMTIVQAIHSNASSFRAASPPRSMSASRARAFAPIARAAASSASAPRVAAAADAAWAHIARYIHAVPGQRFASTSTSARAASSPAPSSMTPSALSSMDVAHRARVVSDALEEDEGLRRAVLARLARDGGALDTDFDRADANSDGVLDKREFLMALGRDASLGARGTCEKVSFRDARAVALSQFVPFMGFGLCDNAIMICAGESIETSLGIGFGLSTMAAAGLGNTMSDVVGIGLSSKIEMFAARFGFAAPTLTKAQSLSSSVRWAKVFGATSGVTVGCLLGMFPLAFGA